MYNQILNRVVGNTKIFRRKTFIPTNNYDLSHKKQPKSNPSLSLPVKSSKYGKWKPILISESHLIQTFVNKRNTNYETIIELWPLPPLPLEISNFQKEHFTFYEWKCIVRIQVVVFTLLTKVTWHNCHCQ